MAEYVRVADLLPNDEDAQLKAGSLLLLAGWFADARGRANKALDANPGTSTRWSCVPTRSQA